jgi:2,5-diketo-D-gluconate reductase A
VLEHAARNKIVIQAYSPLTRTRRLDDETLGEIASNHGKSPAQVLIRWNLAHGAVPLPKASRREHLKQNIDVFDFDLSDEEVATLDGLNERYSALGILPYA